VEPHLQQSISPTAGLSVGVLVPLYVMSTAAQIILALFVSVQDCVDYCFERGFYVTRDWVCRFWQRIDYTEKVVSFKQVRMQKPLGAFVLMACACRRTNTRMTIYGITGFFVSRSATSPG
jgi:hypothetical protein